MKLASACLRCGGDFRIIAFNHDPRSSARSFGSSLRRPSPERGTRRHEVGIADHSCRYRRGNDDPSLKCPFEQRTGTTRRIGD